MKNKLFFIVALVFALSLVLTACGGGSKSITISNNGSVNYCELHVAKGGTNEFGDNQLPDGKTVNPGEKFDIPVTESGAYDVRVVACDGAGEQVVSVNVP